MSHEDTLRIHLPRQSCRQPTASPQSPRVSCDSTPFLTDSLSETLSNITPAITSSSSPYGLSGAARIASTASFAFSTDLFQACRTPAGLLRKFMPSAKFPPWGTASRERKRMMSFFMFGPSGVAISRPSVRRLAPGSIANDMPVKARAHGYPGQQFAELFGFG